MELLTTNQTKKHFRVGNKKIDKWIKEGLPFIEEGNKRLFDVEEINKHLKRKEQKLT